MICADSTKDIADMLAVSYQDAPTNTIIGLVDMSHANLESLLRSAVTVVVKQVSDVIDPRIWQSKPGFTILITGSERAKIMISLVVKISNQPMTSVGSMEEALNIIRSMFPELNEALEQIPTSK